MNLDDVSAIRLLDGRGMLAQINGLPGQLEQAYQLGSALSLLDCSIVERILVVALDGSAVGADLLAAWAVDRLALPMTIQWEESLPAWALNPRTLVILLSHSAKTVGLLAVLGQVVGAGCPFLVLTADSSPVVLGRASGASIWVYPHDHVPRSAVGWTFGLLHTLFFRLGWLPDPRLDLEDGLHAMRNAQMSLQVDVPVVKNPAKRMAGQMVGRWVAVFTTGYLAPVARRWKSQINEMAKTWAQVEILSKARSGVIEGLVNPLDPLQSMLALFLCAPGLDSRSIDRVNLARKFALQQGLNTDLVDARGQSPFAQLWTSLLFADYSTFYLAMANGVDPTLTPVNEFYYAASSE